MFYFPDRGKVNLIFCSLEQLITLEEVLMYGFVEDLLFVVQSIDKSMRSRQRKTRRKVKKEPDFLNSLAEKSEFKILGSSCQSVF